MKRIVIAIDGPASSGKSTVAKVLAEKLNITYLDTGAMYRAVTLFFLREGVDITQADLIRVALDKIQLSFKWVEGQQHIFLNGEDVSDEIRLLEVSNHVSQVSALEEVRKQLVEMQQDFAKQTSVVMDGRDIGTVVLPNADYKFYFVADAMIRAKRRYAENKMRGITGISLNELHEAIVARDKNDSTREHSPLRKADDAIEIDTGSTSVDETVEILLTKMNIS